MCMAMHTKSHVNRVNRKQTRKHCNQIFTNVDVTPYGCKLITETKMFMMTSSNGNIFHVIGHLCDEFTGHRWILHTYLCLLSCFISIFYNDEKCFFFIPVWLYFIVFSWFEFLFCTCQRWRNKEDKSFDVFFDLSLNKRLSIQSWGWWFDTPSCPLWRHCNVDELVFGLAELGVIPNQN